MWLFLITAVFLHGFIVNSIDIPSLPYCPDEREPGLAIVSTLDGKVSVLNSTGSLVWVTDTGPGPLLMSNIHKLELTNIGEWVRIIPSLSGTLYKFDGVTVDPIPITVEKLLKASFRYSDDLVIAGGIEIRTYGVGFHSGTLIYECTSLKCSNRDEGEVVDDVLLIERSTHTIRAVEPRTGHERWNFSVGLHNIKLPKISCINPYMQSYDWNLTAVLPEGKLRASIRHENMEDSWTHIFPSPIVRVWKWNGKNISEIDLFAVENVPGVVSSGLSWPSIYIGMHNKQLYIHESAYYKRNGLRGITGSEVEVTESTSIAKIPWKPIPASTETTEDDSTALSVLNASEYVNGLGFYLYTESDQNQQDPLLCASNHSTVNEPDNWTTYETDPPTGIYILFWWWREVALMLITVIIFRVLFQVYHQQRHKREIILIEKAVEAARQFTERRISEKEGEMFVSRYTNDFDTLRCLGKGGFGVVFEVKQKIDECYYAIKRITLPNETKSRERVMREVKALAKLEHKNIVRYFCSWVEHPPLGWQQEYDGKWIGDKQFENRDISFSSTTNEKMKQRSKSVSIGVDFPTPSTPIRFAEKVPDMFDDGVDNKNVDDDSYIVFENPTDSDSENTRNTPTERIDSTGRGTFDGPSDHLKKKIDWKRPGRKHHSWDLTQNDCVKALDRNNPPIFLYIQMQLCQKESLKDWLAHNLDREFKVILQIFSQILEAVEYVHLRGLIHRDLKPSNIFFSLEGQIKVGDFGLVKDMEDAFDMEQMKKGSSSSYRGHTVEVGTHLYMSPEQFKSRIYDYKVDIYSLGLIFFEMLVPFSTEMERIKMLTNVKYNIFPDNFDECYPNEYNLLKHMLCDDPRKRLTTIGIKARPPFNNKDSGYSEECHYRLNDLHKS
ncbi:unnamed protein product [Phaedon cochleariae]|uniref:non-specific serine/threonine protein kinase n=1 Tax=Phaedon cochleariae TaxID=80249 RepID=A0A9P0GR30_PHACE|nr:unnamed protein product [Phaedon cochleariae]